ncbi:hypothetical protein HDU76_008702, partial [Blyttiomyces sp. JEL0837]
LTRPVVKIVKLTHKSNKQKALSIKGHVLLFKSTTKLVVEKTVPSLKHIDNLIEVAFIGPNAKYQSMFQSSVGRNEIQRSYAHFFGVDASKLVAWTHFLTTFGSPAYKEASLDINNLQDKLNDLVSSILMKTKLIDESSMSAKIDKFSSNNYLGGSDTNEADNILNKCTFIDIAPNKDIFETTEEILGTAQQAV